MKRLSCEVCGSNDLVKQDGVFECQSCGCKYSLEEVRKMMIDGPVDVSGSTIKVDNSAYVEKYLANARRAKEKEDWEETEKYYNLVEQNDPDSIEAIFYSAYGKARASLIDGDVFKREAAFKVLANCISIIDDRYDTARRAENAAAIKAMARDLREMALSDFVYTQKRNEYGIASDNKNVTYQMFARLFLGFRESINNIAAIDDQPYLHAVLHQLFSMPLPKEVKNLLPCSEWAAEEKLKFANAYWKEHPEEFAQINAEESSLLEEINNLENTPEAEAVKRIKDQLSALGKEQASLGFFNSAERKAIQAKINAAHHELEVAKKQEEKVKEATKERLKELRAHVDALAARIAGEV